MLQGWMLEMRRLDTMISHLKVRRGVPQSAVEYLEYPEYRRCSTNAGSAAKRRRYSQHTAHPTQQTKRNNQTSAGQGRGRTLSDCATERLN